MAHDNTFETQADELKAMYGYQEPTTMTLTLKSWEMQTLKFILEADMAEAEEFCKKAGVAEDSTMQTMRSILNKVSAVL